MEVFFLLLYFYLSWEDEYKVTNDILEENKIWSGWREKREETEHRL